MFWGAAASKFEAMMSGRFIYLRIAAVAVSAIALSAVGTAQTSKKVQSLLGKGPADFKKVFGAPTKVFKGKGLNYYYYKVPGTYLFKAREIGGKINWLWIHGKAGADSPQQYLAKLGVKVSGKPSSEKKINKGNLTWAWDRVNNQVSRAFIQKTKVLPHFTEIYAMKEVPKETVLYTVILYGNSRRQSNAAGAGGG